MALHAFTPKNEYNPDTSTHDIIDEAICLFRANILFKNYKIQGSGDKNLIYLTAFIQKCLEQMLRYPAPDQAKKVVDQIVADAKAYEVGQQTFFMNKLGLLNANCSGQEQQKLSAHLKKMTAECAKRLLEYLYRPVEGDMNRKFWLAMGKRPFMGQKFTDKQYQN